MSGAIQHKRKAQDDRELLIDALLGIMNKLGIRAQNLPGPEDFNVLVQHVVSNFGKHTVPEILLAFDMALAGQLPVEANCYENFSCLYFSGIMNAYREWAAEAYKHVVKDAPKALPQPNEDISDEAMEKWLQETKDQKLPVDFMPPQLYEWLVKVKRFNPSGKEKKEAFAMAMAYTYQKLSTAFTNQMTIENREALKRFTQMRESGVLEGQILENLRTLAKKIILYDYLKSL